MQIQSANVVGMFSHFAITAACYCSRTEMLGLPQVHDRHVSSSGKFTSVKTCTAYIFLAQPSY